LLGRDDALAEAVGTTDPIGDGAGDTLALVSVAGVSGAAIAVGELAHPPRRSTIVPAVSMRGIHIGPARYSPAMAAVNS
jgi:hypothetical protein